MIRVPSSVTVCLQKHPKAKPFTVHIDKVKRYLQSTPTTWLEGTNEEQYFTADEAVTAARQAEELESEDIVSGNQPETQGSEDPSSLCRPDTAYDVHEAPLRTRPERRVWLPKHLESFVRK